MQTTKPAWPHANIVRLSAHMGAGQWYKTYRGKNLYFGVLRNPDAALKRYLEWARSIATGEPVAPPPPDTVTLNLGINHALTTRNNDYVQGRLSPGQYLRYRQAAKLIFYMFGRDRTVAGLRPEDFARLRHQIPGGPVHVGNVIRDIRALFAWVDSYYNVRPAYGDQLKKPSARERRLATGRRELWTPQELRILLAHAEPNLRAMVLLGINCGFGQTDCATFRRDCFNLEGHWFARGKTGIERRCPFWPETITAIACTHRWRPDLYSELLLISKYGKLLVRDEPVLNKNGDLTKVRRKDAVLQMLRRACVKEKVKYRPFYSLRHTFRSVADPVADTTAINCVMGHAIPGMAGVYTQLMADGMARLRRVTDHVHAWLYD